jgi:SOS response regulatory protein OraA/RecX
MIKILYIKNTKESHLLSLGIFEGEETARYTLDESFVSEMRLCSGDEITDDTLSEIRRRDEYLRGKRKALSLLSYADNSRRSLLQKLARFGIGRECAEKILSEMVSLGYVNEDAQIERVALRLANVSLFGPKKIMAQLVSKGYSPDAVRAVVRRLSDSGEIDFYENKRRLLEKYSVDESDTDLENKILYKNGF